MAAEDESYEDFIKESRERVKEFDQQEGYVDRSELCIMLALQAGMSSHDVTRTECLGYAIVMLEDVIRERLRSS